METNYKFIVDFEIGTKNEVNLLKVIQNHFNDITIVRSLDRHAHFDYTNNRNILIELKTRSNEHNKYEDTSINVVKINKSKILCKTQSIYFFFKFTDGLYYWKYNKFDKLNYRIGGRSDRSNKYNEKKLYSHIPINLLTKINF